MCRLKYHCLGHKFGWRLAGVTALIFLVLGSISFGYGLRIMEYAEKKDITPVFSAVPMLMAGVLGGGVALSKNKCLVSCYAITSSIVFTLSIHMNNRFMVKEYSLLPLYKMQCQREQHTESQHFCQQYTGTIMLCCVSVSMVPVAVAALLACLIAFKTLKKKNLYFPWFTFSKVEPVDTNSKKRIHGNNNEMITMVDYKQSGELVNREINGKRPSKYYVSEIPDFLELEIPSPSTPAYKDFIVNEFGVAIKAAYSKSLSDLEIGLKDRFYSKDEEKCLSSDLLIKTKNKLDKKRAGIVNDVQECDLVRSNMDVRRGDRDFRKNHNRENRTERQEYYSKSAEDWIELVVDKAHTSRSRLYGVSVDESSFNTDNEFAQNSSTMSLLDKQTNTTESCLRNNIEGIDNASLYASTHLLETTENNTEPTDNDSFLSFRPNDINNESLFQAEHCVGFPRTKRAIDGVGLDPGLYKDISPDFSETAIVNSAVIQQFSKGNTPPGLITPSARCSSPGGQLYFDFDKVTSDNKDVQADLARAATAHARTYWIEFEGE